MKLAHFDLTSTRTFIIAELSANHGNSIETVCAAMTGSSKIRFKIDGADTDFGCAVVDSYAPDPASAAGRTLLGS